MIDMSKTIAPKSDQINADDLIAGPITITITRVSASETPEQPVSVYYAEGDAGKPWKPCKSMRRVMVAAWGKDASQYPGRRITLYCDPNVTFGGMKLGGIRISHMSHIDQAMVIALTTTKSKRAPYTIKPITKPAPTPEPDHTATLEEARQAAMGGRDAMREWWQSNPEKSAIAKSILPDLQAIAAAKDSIEIDL
jgi:hypothetical protein